MSFRVSWLRLRYLVGKIYVMRLASRDDSVYVYMYIYVYLVDKEGSKSLSVDTTIALISAAIRAF